MDVGSAAAAAAAAAADAAMAGGALPGLGGAGYKRARAAYVRRFPGVDKRKLAAVASSKRFAGLYPWSEWGAMRIQRGSPESLSMFGPSGRSANAEQKANRKRTGFTGRGLYMRGRGGYWGSRVGGYLGGLVGHAGLGSRLGDALGDAAGLIFRGSGSYVTNDAISASNTGIPSFSPVGDTAGNTVISFREYICDIYAPDPATQPWNPQVFTLNPGLESTFPYLAQIAQNYEEYTLQQCMFTFKSNIAPIGASSSGQVGEVIMATNYNASSSPYPDKQTALQAALAMSCRASDSMVHGIECDPAKLSGTIGKYIRAGPVGVDEDVKTYDHGILNVCVTGVPAAYANQPIGELWVSYTVALRKPKKFTSLGLGISRDVFASVDTATDAQPFVASNPSTAKGLLTGQQNRIGCALTSNGTNTVLTFPASWAGAVKVRLILRTNGNIVTGTVAEAATTGNVSPLSDLVNGFGGVWMHTAGGIGGANNNTAIFEGHYRVDIVGSNAVDNTISLVSSLTGAGGALTVQSAQLDVEEYNTAFNDTTSHKLLLEDAYGQLVPI